MSSDLSSKYRLPLVGLGTYKIVGDDVHSAVDSALEVGYRLIDTARVYRNEAHIGESLKTLLVKHSLNRSDVFITSKLAPNEHGSGRCRKACLESLKALALDYIDLYLIHWPGVKGLKPSNERQKELRQASWKDLEQLYEEGLLKSIGVSNYTLQHLQELLLHCHVRPAVLQVEYHPHLVQSDVVEFCKANDIQVQAYSSLGTTTVDNKLLRDTTVMTIAEECKRTVSQVLLRWAVQQNIGVIPKSTNPAHIRENFDIFSFELSTDQMTRLSSLENNTRYCWDPSHIT